MRTEARLRNLPWLAHVDDATVKPIYDTAGGNPLALRLVVGQTHVHSLDEILRDLSAARGETAENLYDYIFRWAWSSLDETMRRVFLAMPLASERGGNLAYLADITQLPQGELSQALSKLVSLSLVDSRGDLNGRRFTIHNLTRTFLQEQVARWV